MNKNKKIMKASITYTIPREIQGPCIISNLRFLKDNDAEVCISGNSCVDFDASENKEGTVHITEWEGVSVSTRGSGKLNEFEARDFEEIKNVLSDAFLDSCSINTPEFKEEMQVRFNAISFILEKDDSGMGCLNLQFDGLQDLAPAVD